MMTPHELMFHDTTVLLVSALADTTTLATTFGSCRFSEFRSGPSVVFKCAYALHVCLLSTQTTFIPASEELMGPRLLLTVNHWKNFL